MTTTGTSGKGNGGLHDSHDEGDYVVVTKAPKKEKLDASILRASSWSKSDFLTSA